MDSAVKDKGLSMKAASPSGNAQWTYRWLSDGPEC